MPRAVPLPTSLWPGQRKFSGTVADKTGSVIPGASVKITSQGTGLIRDTKTDSSGHYLVPLLPVAFYTIHVEAQGFQTTEQKDVRLQVDEQREIDFSLNPASITQNIEVSATEVAVETTNPTLGQVITSEEVADLPLERPQFRPARHSHSGDNSIHQPGQLLCQRRQQRSGYPRRLFALGRRFARAEHRLAPRWQRQQSARRRRHRHFLRYRRHPGIQGS